MFDCGGMAFSEAGFQATITIAKVRGFIQTESLPDG